MAITTAMGDHVSSQWYTNTATDNVTISWGGGDSTAAWGGGDSTTTWDSTIGLTSVDTAPDPYDFKKLKDTVEKLKEAMKVSDYEKWLDFFGVDPAMMTEKIKKDKKKSRPHREVNRFTDFLKNVDEES